MPAASSTDMPALLLRRFTSEWRVKLALALLFWVAFSIPYLLLQRFPLFTPRYFELTALDRWIGFTPAWLWVYQSTYLLIPIAPLLSVNRQQLAVYTRGYLLMIAIGIAFFVFFPVEAPRPAKIPTDGIWWALLLYDKTLNTFPSLHVAMVTQSLAFGVFLIGGRWTRTTAIAFTIGVTWSILIAYSTLATKQHYAVDVPAGVTLGLLSHLAGASLRLRAGLQPSLTVRAS